MTTLGCIKRLKAEPVMINVSPVATLSYRDGKYRLGVCKPSKFIYAWIISEKRAKIIINNLLKNRKEG